MLVRSRVRPVTPGDGRGGISGRPVDQQGSRGEQRGAGGSKKGARGAQESKGGAYVRNRP
jgi:hypothetical protein